MTDRLRQLSLVIAMLAGILSLFDAYSTLVRTKALPPDFLDQLINGLYFLFITVALTSLVVLCIVAISLLIANRERAYPVLNKLSDRLAIFTWEDLKILSENPFFKLSYISLVAIPILIYLVKIGFLLSNIEAAKDAIASIEPAAGKLPELPKFHWTVPTNLKISFFSAFSFAIALILLAVFCPKEIKTGPSGAGFQPSTVPPQTDMAKSNAAMRIFCTMFYAIGLFLLVYVLINSAIYVYDS